MVSQLERATAQVRKFAEQDEQQEQVTEKTPKYWLERSLVAYKNLPLHPDCLKGEHIHVSAVTEKERDGQLVVTGGNQTVIDRDYVAYRLGVLLTDLGFSSDDVNAGKPSLQLQNLIVYALEFYPEQYNQRVAEIQQQKLAGNQDKILARAVNPMRQLLVANGLTEAVSWSDEQVAEHIQTMLGSR